MPNAKIEGTQIPIKMADVVSPLKNKYSEKIRDRNAEINNNLSVIVNFENICFIFKQNNIIKVRL